MGSLQGFLFGVYLTLGVVLACLVYIEESRYVPDLKSAWSLTAQLIATVYLWPIMIALVAFDEWRSRS